MTVAISLTGGGSVNGTLISCPSICSASYASGTHETLTASPVSGYMFSQWIGGDCNGSTLTTCALILNSSESVTASFIYLYANSTASTSSVTGTCGVNGLGSGGAICIPFAPALGNFAVNQTAYDSSLNPSPNNCMTLIWDTGSRNGSSLGTVSVSGGANDVDLSLTGQYAVVNQGGVNWPMNFNVSGNCGQLYNTGTLSAACTPAVTQGACPTTNGNIQGNWAFSRQQENFGYLISSANCNGAGCSSASKLVNTTSAFSVLYKITFNCGLASVSATPCPPNTPVPYTSQVLFDFRNCPGLGAAPSSIVGHSGSVLSVHAVDQQWAYDPSFTGGQDTSRFKLVWDPTLGCKVWDTLNGYVFNWCLSSCDTTNGPTNAYYIGTTTNCYGGYLHDGQEKNTQYAKQAQKNGGWSNCSVAGNGGLPTVWDFTQNSVCVSLPCANGALNTTIQAFPSSGANSSGHDSAGYGVDLVGNNPSPNRRPWSDVTNDTIVAHITTGNHSALIDDPAELDLGAWWNSAQNTSGTGNTGFGYDNPPNLYEGESYALVGWQTFTYTGTNGRIVRFGHNFDAEQVQATVTQVQATSSTTAVYTANNVFPSCATGTCGQLKVVVTGCSNTQFNTTTSGLLMTAVSGTSFTLSGSFTPGSALPDNCTAEATGPNFGCVNAIGFPDMSGTWAIIGYDGFGQLGADVANQLFCSAILVRLSPLMVNAPTNLRLSTGARITSNAHVN